jgi:DNA-binding response OmpR family regulator
VTDHECLVAGGPHVLVVEDDAVQAYLVTEALAGSGFGEIRVVTSALAASEALVDWRPDLVILDLVLPDGDGMSLLRLVGTNGTLAIPVLVVTGESDPDRRVLALERGASDLVTKPFNLMELGIRAKRTLRAHDDIQAAGVLVRSLAHELTELTDEVEEQLGAGVDVLLGALALRSTPLGTRAQRVGRSVHHLAVAVHLDDVAIHLGRAAACHEVGALTLSDEDVAGVVHGEPVAAERCALATQMILADRFPLAAAAGRFRSHPSSFERQSDRLVARLTAVSHTFHAAAAHDGFHPARGVKALLDAHPDVLDSDLVDAFVEVCAAATRPID